MTNTEGISRQGGTAMNRLLALAAVGEAATGLLLLVYPPIVARLLIGAEIAGAGVVMSRIAGLSLIALGLVCLPGGDPAGDARALRGMLCYSLLATLYLVYLGFGGFSRHPGDAHHRRREINEAHQIVSHTTGFDFARPAHD